jgi:hypothetical protein
VFALAHLLFVVFFVLLAYLLGMIGGALDGEGWYPVGMSLTCFGYTLALSAIFIVAARLT